MSILNLKAVEDTTLWKRLNELQTDPKYGRDARILCSNVVQICEKAADRMKLANTFSPQYTLHDISHLLRVTEIMSMLISKDVINMLNPLEITILILSAFYHDQGMVLAKDELQLLNKNKEFKLFEDNWLIENPNIKEMKQKINDHAITDAERKSLIKIEHEIDNAILTDFIRVTHGTRGHDFIISEFSNDSLWEISGANLANIVAKICLSHTEPAKELDTNKKFHFDDLIGIYKVNSIFLAVLLRLADILDFDRERTPNVLYRSISFTSKVSIAEWEKHRGVEGWNIAQSLIRYSMTFDHPAYEVVARIFLDMIDNELTNCHSIIREFPKEFINYKLNIPLKVDRSRIGPKNNSYIYYPLEFSLSRDEIVKLLMTDRLYNTPSLCIRELLQNSLDALRYRRALIKRDSNVNWDQGKIVFRHYVDSDGYEILLCKDNGIGMDESIVTKFLTSVGHSFYRSPEFELERISFRNSGVDFDPCSKFGIGFMSSFMLGENIVIETRKDYGPRVGFGKPLIVEINGLSSIVVIKEGRNDQEVGTTVKIKSRKRPKFLDEWNDRVNLTEVLDGYALACEYPIEAYCEIEEIAERFIIEPKVQLLDTEIERAEIKNYRLYEVDFSEIDKNLGGSVKLTILTDSNSISLSNSEAKWAKENDGYALKLNNENKIKQHYRDEDGQTCIDGILVCGQPGRKKEGYKLGWRANAISLSQKHDSFLINIRGVIKPELTPSRIPPEYTVLKKSNSWLRLNHLSNLAVGKLWTKILNDLEKENKLEDFWKFCIVYNLWPNYLTFAEIIKHIKIPLSSNNNIEWESISRLPTFYFLKNLDKIEIYFSDDKRLALTSNLQEMLCTKNNKEFKPDLIWYMQFMITSLASVDLKNNKPLFTITHNGNNQTPMDHIIRKELLGTIQCIPFIGNLKDILCVLSSRSYLNILHPIVDEVLRNPYLEVQSELSNFLENSVHYFSDIENLEELVNKDQKEVNRWTKYFASLYGAINWSIINNQYKPPYKIYSEEHGMITISHEDFMRWDKFPFKKPRIK